MSEVKKRKRVVHSEDETGANASATESVSSVGRSTRPVREPKQALFQDSLSEDWTENELTELLDALTKYGQDDVESLTKCVATKNEREVRFYLDKLIARKSLKNRKPAKTSRAPIEDWLHTIEDVVSNDTDYSRILSQIMSIVGNFEPRDELKESKKTPNYSRIYQYIVALMSGELPPDLSPIEAALILDLLQGLSDHLKSLDTRKQREFMLDKFDDVYAEAQRDVKPNTSGEKPANTSSASRKETEKRPALFSINPFSIPVKYLKLEISQDS